MSYIKRIHIY